MQRKEFLLKLPALAVLPKLDLHSSVNIDKIVKKVPSAKEYIELVREYQREYRGIFEIPLEILAYHFYLESRYNPTVISNRFAVGLAQFMRDTALDLKLKTYSKEKYPELLSLEGKVHSNFDKLRELKFGNPDKIGFAKAFDLNHFELAEKLKLNYDSLYKKTMKLVKEFKDKFDKISRNYTNGKDFDQRLDAEKSIDNGIYLLASLCSKAQEKFQGRIEHNIIRGLACYNYGIKALDYDGLPAVEETINHIRKVIAFADRINLA